MEGSAEGKSSLVKECQAVLTVYLASLVGGMGLGYSTVAISGIQQDRNSTDNHASIIPNVESSEEDLSWFAGVMTIGTLLGSLPGGLLGARIGPKKTIIISTIPGILGWILIATAPHLSSLIIGRILCGLSGSFMLTNSQTLVAQYSSKIRRGVFLSMFSLNEALGITLVYSLAIVLSWRLVAAIPCLIYLISVGCLWLIPEAPIWLLVNRGREEAENSLRWLRGRTDVDTELLELDMIKENQNKKVGIKVALRNLSRPDINKPFLLVLCVLVGSILMGKFYFVFYAVQIFKKAGVHGNQLLPAILTGVLQIVGVLVGFFLIQRLKRITLASLSISTCCLSMGVLGASFYLKSIGQETSATQAMPIVCVSIYLFSHSCGIGPISFIFIGELMPPEYTVLTGLIFVVCTFFMFLSIKLTPVLAIFLQPHGLYWLFSGICLILNIFFLFVMPETKGKSMLQIRQLFVKKSHSRAEDSKRDTHTQQTNDISSNTKFLKT